MKISPHITLFHSICSEYKCYTATFVINVTLPCTCTYSLPCNINDLLSSDLRAESVEQRWSNPKLVGSIPTLVRVFLCPCVGGNSISRANAHMHGLWVENKHFTLHSIIQSVMLGDRQNYTRSPCRPATHLLSLVDQLHARHNAFFSNWKVKFRWTST